MENRDRNVKINLTAPGPANTEMNPGPLPPERCHPTVEWLLDLEEDGPTGRFFWLGAELPMFPDLGEIRYGEGIADPAVSPPLDAVEGDPVQRAEG